MTYSLNVWQLALVISSFLSTSIISHTDAACVSLIKNNPNAKFYASTSLFPLGHPVLHSNQFWCAGVISRGQRLMVDLGLRNLIVDQVSVQGMPGTRRSVSEYLLYVSTDNKTFTEVLEAEDGRREFFGPNFNGDTVVSSNLTTPATARWVVFNPEEPLTPSENNLCMRVDVLSCGKAPTPVDGGLSQWSSWSQCSCNQVTTRTRSCTNPAPAFGGRPCAGHKKEDQFCSNTNCPPNWSNWNSWTPCSATCGRGTRTRARVCNNPTPPPGGNAYCVGLPVEVEGCTVRDCPTTSPPTTTLPQTTTPLPETTKPPSTTASPNTTTSSAPTTGVGNYTTAAPTTRPTPTPTAGINRTYIDIVFTLIASSDFSNETYALMETTAKQFIEEYEYVNYYVIAYVDGVLKMVNFSFGANESNAAARRARRAVGASEPLITVLKEALVVFQNNSLGESNNRKALVVMTDISSSADKNSLEKAVRPIEEGGILVISVPIGAVDRKELLVISPNPLDVISVDRNILPLPLAQRIGERIIRKIPEIDVGFAISVSSVESTVIYDVMVQASRTINERYRDFRVRFNIIVYGTKKTTRLSEFFNTLLSHNDLITSVRNLTDVSSSALQEKLREAENLFRSTGRPFAKRVFVPITDAGNGNEIITASNILRSHGIVLLSLNENVDQLSSVTISHVDNLGTPNATTDRRVVIAEAIIYQALRVNIPELDVTFALSATSINSSATFTRMKTTIIDFIRQYGINRIHYSAIVFGSGIASTGFDFATQIPDQDELIRRVIRLKSNSGGPNLAQGLEEAKRIFNLQQVRPNARRILVVIMDNASVNRREDLAPVVHALVNNTVFIAAVGIGPSVNPTDLNILTREERHTLQVGINKAPGELREEIMKIIEHGLRTAGFSLWSWWSACSKTCGSFGVAGTQERTRICIKRILGCEGQIRETRTCNPEACQACGERVLPDNSYQASSNFGDASLARLNSSNPKGSLSAWCRGVNDPVGFIQLDLGELVNVSLVATKGQELPGAEHWVESFFLSVSPKGLSYQNYTEGGVLKIFTGNVDPTEVKFNKLNMTDPVQYVRFHPIKSREMPCMQASVFGCTVVDTDPSVRPVTGGFLTSTEGKGILIALWVLAGILTSLLLMACCYYCCWHVCCGKNKKRKGLTHRILIEDDADKRWVLMPTGMEPGLNRPPQSEIQEVVVEIGEESGKPSGVIQFGVEADQSKENRVTAETVHSELPVYSEEAATVDSNATTLKMEPADPRYANLTKRKANRTKSDSAGSFKTRGKISSGFPNGGFDGSSEWLSDSFDNDGMNRARSLDDLAIVDYEMFEERRGSDQSAGIGGDGYRRMKETSRESVNKHHVAMEEKVLSFMSKNGDQNMEVLESWFNPDGGAEEPRQNKDKNEPVYSAVGAQIPRDDPVYSEVGSQIRKDESIYSEVGSQIPK